MGGEARRQSWRPLVVAALVVVAGVALDLVINLVAGLVQVSTGWWPYALVGALVVLVVVVVLIHQYEQVEPANLSGPLPSDCDAVVVVGRVPQLAEAFRAREIEQQLARVSESTVVLTQVVSGLGGVGKTQLAAALAHQAQDARAVEVLVWVDARHPDSIIAQYQLAARQIGLPIDGASPEQAAQMFLDRLSSTAAPWLVVLDDLIDPDHLTSWWPPNTTVGRTVVTTRRVDAVLDQGGRRCVPVGVYTEAEAHDYLVEILDRKPRLADDVAGVVADLGRLPLALSHAAALMVDLDLSCSQYRLRFAARRHLAEVMPKQALPDQYTLAVSATLGLSVDSANAVAPTGLAESLLMLASVLATTSPRALYTTHPARAWLAHHSAGQDEDVPLELREQDARDGLYCLRRFSLIDLTDDTVTVHNLVQAITRDRNTNTLPQAARATADALLEIWPDNDATTGELLRRNATVQATYLSATEPPHPIRGRHASSTGATGNVAGAVVDFEALLADQLRMLGPDHPDTLIVRSNLASWRGEAGDVAGAVTELEEVLVDRLRVLGPDHPDTLISRNNLASSRGHAGDVVGAVADFEALLADQLRMLGPDHPDTLLTRSNLASWRGEAGDVAGAVTELEEVLADRLRVLGPDHPDTLTARSNLAASRGEAGDVAGAVTTYEALLAGRLRVLGPDHPATLGTRSNLAHWRGEAGDVAGAVTELEEVLADRLRVLGPDHPNTLAARSNLTVSRGEAGDVADLVTELEEVLADRLRVLGPDHPDTLLTRSNLAHWRGETGDMAGAVTEYQALLTDQEQVLGPDHPRTLATRNNLASWRGEAGDVAGAVTELEAVLADQNQVLAPDHPDTLLTRSNLAHFRGEAGDVAGAVTEFEALLADQQRVLGPDHPGTLLTWSDLAHLREEHPRS